MSGKAPAISAADLIDMVRAEFERQGETPPCEKSILVLARLVAGYIRTCPLPGCDADEARAATVAAFVSAYPGWSVRDAAEYRRVAALLDNVFHQREADVPSPFAIDMLHGITVGMMRRKRMSRAHAAQLAMAGWIASLYLAGLDDG